MQLHLGQQKFFSLESKIWFPLFAYATPTAPSSVGTKTY